jgi:predicted small secreted protein
MTGRIRLPNAAAEFEVRSFAYGSIAALLLAAALLSGCNTAKGIGDDVENAANKVEDAVD